METQPAPTKPGRPRQFGRTWNPKTPRDSITRIVNAMHVSVSDAEVRSEIQRRVDVQRMRNPVGWTPAIIQQSLDFAILVHRANQDLFKRVMGGHDETPSQQQAANRHVHALRALLSRLERARLPHKPIRLCTARSGLDTARLSGLVRTS